MVRSDKIMFSIIVPVYNVEKYIQQSITSVINQTYSNWELILVNDGSSDGSERIISSYQKVDNRIKVINKQNTGVSDSRNAGISNAIGDYVLFLDADDSYHKNLLQVISDKNMNDDIIMFDYNYKNKKTNRLINKDKVPSKLVIKSLFLRKSMGFAWQFAIKREKLMETKFFDVNLSMMEDIDWALTLLNQTDYVRYINQKLYNYQIRSDSTSHDISRNKLNNLENAVNKIKTRTIIQLNDVDQEVIIWEKDLNITRYYHYVLLGWPSKRFKSDLRKNIIDGGLGGLEKIKKFIFVLIKIKLI